MQGSGCGKVTSLLTPSSGFDPSLSITLCILWSPWPSGRASCDHCPFWSPAAGSPDAKSQPWDNCTVHIASSPSYPVKLPPELLTRTLLHVSVTVSPLESASSGRVLQACSASGTHRPCSRPMTPISLFTPGSEPAVLRAGGKTESTIQVARAVQAPCCPLDSFALLNEQERAPPHSCRSPAGLAFLSPNLAF